MGLLLLCSLGLMFVVTLYMNRHFPGSFAILIAGGLGFFIVQILIRMPIVQGLQTVIEEPYVVLIMLASSAAFVETVARYLVVRFMLKDRLCWSGGIAAGIGHGFCEMLFLFVFAYAINIILHLGGGNIPLLETTVAITPLYFYGLAFLERLFAICFHIAMSLMMVQGFMKNKKVLFSLIIFMLHFSLDGIVAYLQLQGMNTFFIEAFLALCACLSILYIVKMGSLMKDAYALPKDPGEQAVVEGY